MTEAPSEALGPMEAFESYESFEPFRRRWSRRRRAHPRHRAALAEVAVLRPAWQSGHAARRRTGHVRGDAEGDRDPTTDKHFIYLLAWWCDPWVNLTGPGSALLDLFAAAGKKECRSGCSSGMRHGCRVSAISPYSPTCRPRPQPDPELPAQQDNAGGAKSHHQKLLVVKGSEGLITFCGGIDVNADRRYTLPPPPGSYRTDRPSELSWIGGSGGSGSGTATGKPLHDVHARVAGRASLAAPGVPSAVVGSLR